MFVFFINNTVALQLLSKNVIMIFESSKIYFVNTDVHALK